MIDKWLRQTFGDVVDASHDWRVDCPFCVSRGSKALDTKKHLYVSKEKSVCHCFRCEFASTHAGLICNIDGVTFSVALEYLVEPKPDISKFDIIRTIKPHSPSGLVQVDQEYPPGFTPYTSCLGLGIEYNAVRKYVRRRKVPPELMDNFGCIPGTGRVWILIDKNWWQGRAISGQFVKYMSPEWPIGESLWNAEALEMYDDVVICEGVFSAIGWYNHTGVNNALAVCGKSVKGLQLRRIIRSSVASITLAFDNNALEEAYNTITRMRMAGFSGDLHVLHLVRGDPWDGVDGTVVTNIDFSDTVRFKLGLV